MKIYEVQRAFVTNNRSDQQLRAFLFNVQTYCENSRHLNIEQIIDAFVSTHSMFPSFDAAVESLFDLADCITNYVGQGLAELMILSAQVQWSRIPVTAQTHA